MRKQAKKLVVYSSGTVIFIAILAISLYALRSASTTRWVQEDAGNLKPYSHVLIPGETTGDTSDIDGVLIEALSEDRLVAKMSRSDYRHSLVGNESLVKVHLVTSKPGEESVRIQIKLLVTLEKNQGHWEIGQVKELALP